MKKLENDLLIDKCTQKYRKLPVVIEAIQWNVPDKNGKVKLARECEDHPKVRPTSYLEVSDRKSTRLNSSH